MTISANRLKQIARAKIGPRELLFPTLVTPQCFSLIFANLIAALNTVNSELIVGMYLYCLVFVLIFSQVLHWCNFNYQGSVVILYTLALSAILFFFSLFSGLTPFHSFALPVSFVLAGLVFVPATVSQKILFCAPPFLFSVVLFTFDASREGVQVESLLSFVILLVPLLVLLAGKSTINVSTSNKRHSPPREVEFENYSEQLNLDELFSKVKKDFARMESSDLRRDIFWFPLYFSITSLGCVLLLNGFRPSTFAILAVLITLQALLQVTIWKNSGTQHLQILTILQLVIVGSWALLLFAKLGSLQFVVPAVSMLIYIWLIGISLKMRYFAVGLLLWSLFYLVVVSLDDSILALSALLPIWIAFGLIVSYSSEILRSFERSSFFLARLNPRLSSEQRLGFIAHCTARLKIGPGVFLFLDPQRVYHCTVDRVRALGRTPEKGKNEFEFLRQVDGEAGLLKFAEINESLRLTLFNRLKSKPSKLIYFRFSYMQRERPCEGYLLVPMSLLVVLLWKRRVFRKILPVMLLLARSLAQSHRDLESAAKFSSMEQSIGMYDRYIGLIAHDINNLTQEICSSCDLLNSLVSNHPSGNYDQSDQIMRVERLAEHVSYTISDARLLYELSRIKRFTSRHLVPTDRFFRDFQDYLVSYSAVKRKVLKSTHSGHSNIAISVSNEDYLAASIRWLARTIIQNIPGRTELLVGFDHVDDKFSLSFRSDADFTEQVELRYLLSLISGDSPNAPSPQALAVSKFISIGELECELSLKPLFLQLSFSVEDYQADSDSTLSSGESGWILFVDDNPEVLQFYSRVASALRIDCKTAESVSDATSLLDHKSLPMLVVTDLQLAEGSGIDLIEVIRERFGNDLKVVVVSGDKESIESGLGEQHQVFKTFTKPLSKARLFSELEAILQGHRGAEATSREYGK